jgi:hypothetical protein
MEQLNKSGNRRGMYTNRITGIDNNKYKHGLSHTWLYKKYRKIIERCYDPNCKAYRYYGAKGVKLSDEFLNDFKVFYDYMLEIGWYRGCDISRYNDVGNYERGNLKILTHSQNTREAAVIKGTKIMCKETQQIFLTVVDAAQWIKDTYKYDGKTKTVAENIRCKGLKGSVSYGHTWVVIPYDTQ